MKSRDKMAALALIAMASGDESMFTDGRHHDQASDAYAIADAMIKASGDSLLERSKEKLILVGENIIAAIVGSFAFGYWQHDWRAGLAFLCFLAVMAPEVK